MPPPQPRPPTPHRLGQPHARAPRPDIAELLTQLRTELLGALAGAESRIVARARDIGAPVPLARQLLSQAPATAVSYRLALPADSVGGKPRYAPRKTAAGTVPSWTVQPLQLPDDDRLREGEVYRIVWLDAQGRRIPPSPAAGVPGLRYFLARATLSDDPVDQQYEQALAAAVGQPGEPQVRQQIAQRCLRRARELEEQAALDRKAKRDAEELRRTEAHLAEARKQTEALAQVQRRAKELADAQVAAQHPTWQLWLPVALSFLPALVQVGLLLWDRLPSDSDPEGKQGEDSQNRLRGAFHDALAQIGDALGKLSAPSPLQTKPPLQPVAAASTNSLSASATPAAPTAVTAPAAPAAAEPEVRLPGPSLKETAPQHQNAESTSCGMPTFQELEQKKARLAEIQLELASLAQASDSLVKMQRLQNLHSEVAQLVHQAQVLTHRQALSIPAESTPQSVGPIASSSPPPPLDIWSQQLQPKVARIYELDAQHQALVTQPPSPERDRRLAACAAEAKALFAQLTADAGGEQKTTADRMS